MPNTAKSGFKVGLLFLGLFTLSFCSGSGSSGASGPDLPPPEYGYSYNVDSYYDPVHSEPPPVEFFESLGQYIVDHFGATLGDPYHEVKIELLDCAGGGLGPSYPKITVCDDPYRIAAEFYDNDTLLEFFPVFVAGALARMYLLQFHDQDRSIWDFDSYDRLGAGLILRVLPQNKTEFNDAVWSVYLTGEFLSFFPKPNDWPYADKERERAANYVCWAIGADPSLEKQADVAQLIKQLGIPNGRNCEGEYNNVAAEAEKFFKPFVL